MMMEQILILLAGYLCLTSFLGIRAQKRSVSTADDYFLARRSISWIQLGLTFFATWFSTLAFLAVAGFNFNRGVSWYFAQGTFWMLAPISAWILGRRIWLLGKQKGYVTPGDLLADSFDSNLMRFIVGALCTLSLVPYILVQLVGIGKVLEASTLGEIPYSLGVLLTAAAIALYTILGGVRAVIWTDMIQGLLFLGVTVLAVYVSAEAAGGLFDGLVSAQQKRPDLFTIDMSNIGEPLTTIIIWAPGFAILPHLWQRNYMAKSEASFAKGILVFGISSFVMLIATMLIGTVAISYVDSISDSDKLIPFLFRDHVPALLPLLVLATFAAGMSTMDSQLLTAASVLLRDVMRPLGLRSYSSSRERLLGRIVVVSLILFLTSLALLPESQGAIFTLASKGTAIALLLLIPLCASFARRGTSSLVGIGTLVSGAIVLGTLELGVFQYSLPFGFGAPVAALLVQLAVYFLLNKLNCHNLTNR